MMKRKTILLSLVVTLSVVIMLFLFLTKTSGLAAQAGYLQGSFTTTVTGVQEFRYDNGVNKLGDMITVDYYTTSVSFDKGLLNLKVNVLDTHCATQKADKTYNKDLHGNNSYAHGVNFSESGIITYGLMHYRGGNPDSPSNWTAISNNAYKFNARSAGTWTKESIAVTDATIDGRYRVYLQVIFYGERAFMQPHVCTYYSTHEFTVNSKSPTLTHNLSDGLISDGKYYLKTNPKFSWTNGENETTPTLILNGKSVGLSNYSYTILTEGQYAVSASPGGAWTVVYDVTAPTVSISKSSYKNGETVVISANDTNFSHIRIDSTEYSESTKSLAASSFSDGRHTVTAYDKAGNISAETFFETHTTMPSGTLSGVSNGGRTKNSVSLTWSSTSVTAKLNGTDYMAGRIISAEGFHRIELTDQYGNTTVYSFEIDKTPPNAVIKATDNTILSPNISTNKSFIVSCSELNSRLYYKQSAGGDYLPYSGITLTAEGTYWFAADDALGNRQTFYMTIDRDVSYRIVGSYQVTGTNSYLSNNAIFVVAEETLAELTLNGSTYVSGQKIESDGIYNFRLSDFAGNTVSFSFLIDTTAPILAELPRWTNTYFTFFAQDQGSGIKQVIYEHSGERFTTVSDKVSVALSSDNYGEWKFCAIDRAGNVSEWTTVSLYYRETFANLETIKNGYKVNAWYRVNLPTKIYTDCSGNYSFVSYTDALKFTIDKEWKYRVETLSGERWSYVNISNETVRQIYTDRTELDRAVEKYAASYVSERTVFTNGGNNYNRPTDGNGVTRDDALTQNNIVLPEHLSEYKDLALYLIAHQFAWVNLPGIEGNRNTLKIRYVSDGISNKNGADIELQYGAAIKGQLTVLGMWQQGYYMVTEEDLCGNIERYLVCIDTGAPFAVGTAEYGSGAVEQIRFDDVYISEYQSVLLFISLQLSSLVDSIDDLSCVRIIGRKLDNYYTNFDELPFLTYANGYYGTYTILIYDRSFNTLEFSVKIAGATPYLTHSSLTNEVKCTFTLNCDDTGNAITEVHMYKLSYDGSRTELYTDSEGLPVTAENLKYVLTSGGKYVIEFVDIYGRSTATDPIFYMKGLPSGTLSCADGGVTRNNVTLRFANENKLMLYRWSAGVWELVESGSFFDLEVRADITVATVYASIQSSAQYKFFLYKSTDMNLFSEYRFEIDCVAPITEIINTHGENLERDGVTTDPFYLTWTESNVTVYWYSSKTPGGEFGKQRYVKGAILDKAATYYFIITDRVGNEDKYTITLDNIVSYTLDGNYKVFGDEFVSKNYLVFTVTERTARFTCESNNGLSIANGQRIEVDGIYIFTVEDLYGNLIILTLIIDKLPPTVEVKTADGEMVNGRTRDSFNVSCVENDVVIQVSRDNVKFTAYTGQTLTEEGVFYFIATDRMGNALRFQVVIDRNVTFEVVGRYINIDENTYAAKDYLMINVTEEYTSFTVENFEGKTFTSGDRVTEEGVYIVRIEDSCGNFVRFTIIIDRTAPLATILLFDNTTISPNGLTNQAFTVLCLEEGSKIYYTTQKGGLYVTYDGKYFDLDGVYWFAVDDILGNRNSFTVTIDLAVQFEILGNSVYLDFGKYGSSAWLTINVLEPVKNYSIIDLNGNDYLLSDRLTEENTYVVHIEDMSGNSLKLILIIDRTPPMPIITLIDESKISINTKTNQGFNVACEEQGSYITFTTQKNGVYLAYDGRVLHDPGIYYFALYDTIGNRRLFTVTIDQEVQFEIVGNYVEIDAFTFGSNTWMAVNVLEDYKSFSVSNGKVFVAGERVVEEGVYIVQIEDLGGNIVVIKLVISRQPPVVIIETVSGESIGINSFVNKPIVLSSVSGVSIVWSTQKNGTYMTYEGQLFDSSGIYYFQAKDELGNIIEFTVTIDYAVSFEVGGIYNKIDDHTFASKSWVVVNMLEKYLSFDVNCATGKTFKAGERISEEGEYFIRIEDLSGNVVVLKIIVDFSSPIIMLEGVEIGGSTRSNVIVRCTEEISLYLTTEQGKVISEISNGQTLNEHGIYYILARNRAGAETRIQFKIDLEVEGKITVEGNPLENGRYLTGVVSLVFSEAVDCKLTKDGADTVFSQKIRDSGRYVLVVTDRLGNTLELIWTILPEVAREYCFPTDDLRKIIKDSNELDIVGTEMLLNLDGKYIVAFNDYELQLIVDRTPPTVEIVKESNNFVIKNPSKNNVSIQLLRNGVEVNAKIGQAVKDTGKYLLIVTDEYGNENRYEFKLSYINTWGIVLIIFGCFVATGIGYIVYRARRQMKVK